MLFVYHAIDQDGHERQGTIEAPSREIAVSALQRRNLVISLIDSAEKKSILQMNIGFLNRVSNKEIVILSRQISTLFESQVSALRVFRLLAAEVENKYLASVLTAVSDDLQGGSPISKALTKHPKVFSAFYVNMVRAGEESGNLSETFNYLSDYLDRSYAITTKAENALIYPAFVVVVFFSVMALMLTLVIPKISAVLLDSGQQIPVFTKIVIGFANFLTHYGIFMLIALVVAGFYVWKIGQTENGKIYLDGLKLGVPYIGDLYRKLYLSRISDNLATMLASGLSVVEAIEITSSVVGNAAYQQILKEVSASVKGGLSIAESFGQHPEIPGILIVMTRVGEETGELGKILSTLSKFYSREVVNAVDALVGLIEPAMIVFLGAGVSILLTAVLMPIYNLAGSI